MSKDTGGSAFPTIETNYRNENMRSEGMTLRDYMAGKALAGFCANPLCSPETQQHFDNLAEDAYRVADAMLKECSK